MDNVWSPEIIGTLGIPFDKYKKTKPMTNGGIKSLAKGIREIKRVLINCLALGRNTWSRFCAPLSR